jgi:hypothetical protein
MFPTFDRWGVLELYSMAENQIDFKIYSNQLLTLALSVCAKQLVLINHHCFTYMHHRKLVWNSMFVLVFIDD